MAEAAPKVPTRTDAVVACDCGGTARIVAVSPLPERPNHMHHVYRCGTCGSDLAFDVAKKAKG